MNNVRPIDATVLLNHIAVLERHDEDIMFTPADIKRIVRSLPELHSRRKGKWITTDDLVIDEHTFTVESRIPNGAFLCSECRCAFSKKKLVYTNYCQNCGATMEVE